MLVIRVVGVNSGSGQTFVEMDNGGITFLDLSKGPSYWGNDIYMTSKEKRIAEVYITLKIF